MAHEHKQHEPAKASAEQSRWLAIVTLGHEDSNFAENVFGITNVADGIAKASQASHKAFFHSRAKEGNADVTFAFIVTPVPGLEANIPSLAGSMSEAVLSGLESADYNPAFAIVRGAHLLEVGPEKCHIPDDPAELLDAIDGPVDVSEDVQDNFHSYSEFSTLLANM